ncbi:MAG: DUF3822 family protein [Bacteroidota bacterium]|nr:DUF3822 family protein [Bacteroidota bacterium]
MMKTLLEIIPEDIEPSQSSLLLEISGEELSITIKNDQESRFDAAAIYQFEHGIPYKNFAKALDSTLQKHHVLKREFKEVKVVYSYPECVLMPLELFNPENHRDMLSMVCGDMDQHTSVLTDPASDNENYTLYRIPSEIEKILQSNYPNHHHQHLYSSLLQVLPPKEDALYAFFSSQRIRVKLNLNGSTQLINTFEFVTPTDAAYILLYICQQYEIPNLPIEIGGLIEKDSMLYKELYKYFHDIRFSSLPKSCRASEAISQIPAHYFSPIFAVHACES